MTQIGTVSQVLDTETALVAVKRQTACGHDCDHCGGCGVSGGVITVRAETALPVSPGDTVELASGNRHVLGIAALVYLGPVALFLLGYMLPTEAETAVRCLCGVLGFAVGLLVAMGLDRRLRQTGNAVAHRVVRRL